MTLQDDYAAWHERRWSTATVETMMMKLSEEVGEFAAAVHYHVRPDHVPGKKDTDVGKEAADILGVMFIILGRWFPDVDLLKAAQCNLDLLLTPGAHKSGNPA